MVAVSNIKEDVWISTACYGCYNACGVRAHRVDGIVVDIAGDPENPSSLGHICAKGKARIMDLYDPERVVHPLRRRNPEKGVGVDPQWERISWDEALELVAEKLKAARAQDPKSILVAHFDLNAAPLVRAWCTAIGTPHTNWSSAGMFCGMGSHTVNMLVNGSYNSEVDFEHCEHLVLVGSQMGFMVDSNAQFTTHNLARARQRGMKVTVVDPLCGAAASKADSWMPIRPGTDAALGLAIVHQLLNVLGVYDAPFLQRRTNATYLIGPDGQYVRGVENKKPLVWDLAAGRAGSFDEVASQDAALEGTFTIEGVECRPAFALLREHVRRYTPEYAAQITDVPAEQIVELARQLARDAHVGETVEVDGFELAYRPVAVIFKMGAVGHKHGMATGLALHLINIVLGAIDVVGSFLGVNPVGPNWEPEVGADGMLVAAEHVRSLFGYNSPFPGGPVQRPRSLSLEEILPIAVGGRVMYPFTILAREDFGLDIVPQVLLHSRVNLMMTVVDPKAIAQVLKRVPFMVSFATHLDETAEFADLVLPDAHDLERYDLFPANHPYCFLVPGPGSWYGALRQPVVPPKGESRHWGDVLLDLGYRLGLDEELHTACQALFNVKPDQLPPNGRLTVQYLGAHGLSAAAGDAAAKVGLPNTSSTFKPRAKYVQEAYPGNWIKARVPIYEEHFIRKGREVTAALAGTKVKWDVSDYTPLPEWRPSAAHEQDPAVYDLFAIPFKLPFMALSLSAQNPWLADLGERHPYAFCLIMHRRAAEARGIADGDRVTVTSSAGTITGRVRVTEGIHPEAVGIGGTHGHWAKGMSVARGRGLHFNSLVPLDLEVVDKLSSAFDSKVKVRVAKVAGGPPRAPTWTVRLLAGWPFSRRSL